MATSGRLPGSQHPLFTRINTSLEFDRRLWPQDIEASRAHIGALHRAAVLTDEEHALLLDGLDRVSGELERNELELRDDDEDIHTAVERRLTEIVGGVGGKLHTGRSRNDQVATDLVLYVRDHALEAELMTPFFISDLFATAR